MNNDLISRQDAIEAVYQALRTPVPNYKNDFFHDSMSLAVNIVKNIPSAEPERKKGKWVEIDFQDGHMYGYHTCSICKAKYSLTFDTPPDFKFCPNCGADMTRGE